MKATTVTTIGGRLWFICAVALVLRVVWAIITPNEPIHDCFVYHIGAAQIAAGNGFAFENGDLNAYWPVGYSAFIGFFYALLGPHLSVAFAANIGAGVALVALVFLLGKRVAGPTVGALCAWITALYPSFIAYPTVLASENLYNPLIVALGLLLHDLFVVRRQADGAALGTTALAGAVLGLAILVRPTALAIPGIALVMAVLAKERRAIVRAVVIGAIGVLVCVPWGLRNKHQFGVFKLSAFNGGAVLWFGNHDGGPSVEYPERFASLNVVERDRAMGREAVAYIRSNPDRYLKFMVQRIATAMKSETIAGHWNRPGLTKRFGKHGVTAFNALASAVWLILLAATVLGAFKWLTRGGVAHQPLLFLVLFMLVNAAPFVFIDSQNRYHLPMVPFMTVFAVSTAMVGRPWFQSIERYLRVDSEAQA